MSSWIIQSDSNPCTWHLILTSLAPSIAGNTMVTLTGASHCHIVWNSNNSVIATTRAVHYCPGTFFNQFNLKTTLESGAIIEFFSMAFLYLVALFWHGTIAIALYHYQLQEQDTGTIKQFIFPAQLMFCWWLWSPLPLTVEARGPRYRQLHIPLGFIFTTMGAKLFSIFFAVSSFQMLHF